jgi:hypothetical protein
LREVVKGICLKWRKRTNGPGNGNGWFERLRNNGGMYPIWDAAVESQHRVLDLIRSNNWVMEKLFQRQWVVGVFGSTEKDADAMETLRRFFDHTIILNMITILENEITSNSFSCTNFIWTTYRRVVAWILRKSLSNLPSTALPKSPLLCPIISLILQTYPNT